MDNINIAISEPSRSGRAAISNSSKPDNTGKNGINDEAVSSEKQSFSDSMEKVAKKIQNNKDARDTKVDGKNLPVSENSTGNTASKAAEGDRSYSLAKADLSESNTSPADNLASASIDQLLQTEPGSLTDSTLLENSSLAENLSISSSEVSRQVLNDIGVQLEMSQLTSPLSADSAIQSVIMSDLQVTPLTQPEVTDTAAANANSATNSTINAIGVATTGIIPNRQALLPEVKPMDISLNGLNTPLATQQATVNPDGQSPIVLPASSATLTQQSDMPQLKQDDIAMLAQKNQLSAQLSGLSGEQSTITADKQFSQLLQAAGLSVDSTNSTLSASLNTASNNTTPINFNAVSQLASQTASPVSQQASPLTSSSGLFQSEIVEPFGRPAWAQSMGKQVLMMVNQNINSAEIRLNPANLGPIEVRIDMSDDQINVALNSRSAAVREAMEMALPKLREMFDNNGLNLAGTDISQHSFAEQREQNTARDSNLFNRSINQSDLAFAGSEIIQQVQLSNRMVDYYI